MTAADEPFAVYVERMLTVRGWSVDDCAEAAGLSPSVVFRWLHHGFVPNVRTARSVAHAFGVPVLELRAGQLTADEVRADVDTSWCP